jgi:hypothetical protein
MKDHLHTKTAVEFFFQGRIFIYLGYVADQHHECESLLVCWGPFGGGKNRTEKYTLKEEQLSQDAKLIDYDMLTVRDACISVLCRCLIGPLYVSSKEATNCLHC